MATLLSLCIKIIFIFILLILTIYGRWVGLFAALIPLSVAEIIIPVPLAGFNQYRAFIYFMPIGLMILIGKYLFSERKLIEKINKKVGTLESEINICRILIFVFFFIIALNYLRSGVDIIFITEGINFIAFHNQVLLPIFLMLLIPRILTSERDFKTFMIAIAGGAIILLIDSLMLRAGFSSGLVTLRGQAGQLLEAEGVGGTATRFGQMSRVALFLLPLAIAFITKENTKYGTCFFLLIIAFLSGGRIATGSVIVGTGLYFFILKRHQVPVILKICLVGLALMAIVSLRFVGVMDAQTLSKYNARIVDSELYKKSWSGRLSVYTKSLQLAMKNPLIGIGPMDKTTEAKILKKYGPATDEYLARKGTHMTFANILAINGVFALLLYLAFYSIAVKSLSRLYFKERESFVGKMALMLLVFFIVTAFRYLVEGKAEGGDWFFYLNVGIFFALPELIKSQYQAETVT